MRSSLRHPLAVLLLAVLLGVIAAVVVGNLIGSTAAVVTFLAFLVVGIVLAL